MDLKIGMEELKKSKTFKEILKILKEVGNYLNSSDVSQRTNERMRKVFLFSNLR